MADSLLRVSGLSWTPPDGAGVHGGLRDVGFSADGGEFLLIAGPSGGGKTTLLRLLAGLEERSGGEIFLDGKETSALYPPVLRRTMALLPQTPTVTDDTILNNLLLPFSFKANADLRRPDDETLRALLAEFLLDGMDLQANARILSTGQRQRLCLIRSLVLEPRILLMDEPVSALDPESRSAVEEAAQRLCLSRGACVIFVSHAGFAPTLVSPRRLVLKDGTLREETA